MTGNRPGTVSPHDMVASGLCSGCGACAGLDAGSGAVIDWTADGHLAPRGPARWYRRRSGEFSAVCPFSPQARDEDAIAEDRFPAARARDRWIGRFDAAYIGHVTEPGYRERGSSGGMVSWVAAELLRQGLVDGVAHVVPADPQDEGRFFRYRVSRDLDQIHEGARSRYYPVEMSGVLEEIRHVPGQYAIVGVPCFIKAVHLLRARDPVLRTRIPFLLGLVCGHMKGRFMVESFAWQMGMPVEALARVEFRVKNPERPANWYTARLSSRDGATRSRDWWHLVDGDWGSGFFQNPACDFCDDVVGETADISFGDAWAEPWSSDGRGTNVAVVRSPELHGLVSRAMQDGRLALVPVGADVVRQTQAAGFRQRREGLSYRLGWRKRGVRPVKRVRPGDASPALRRRLIYRYRNHISRWSGRMFRLAKRLRQPWLFTAWARLALSVYHGLTYSRGRIGRLLDRIMPPAVR